MISEQKHIMTKTIPLATPSYYDFDQCLFFLDRNFDECLYVLRDRSIHRAIYFNSSLTPFTVSETNGKLILKVAKSISNDEQNAVISFVLEWFDLDRDLNPFYNLLSENPVLNELTTKYEGLRLIGIPDLFEAMCWSIIGQQINLTFAYKLKRRLVEAYGESIDYQGHTLYHFPTPEALVNLDEDFLKTQQFSRGKIQYLKNVALAFLEEGLSKESLTKIPDFETRQKQLTKIKGIGIWSANYALMKTLHQPEAIPFGDTGLTQALFNLKIIEDRKDEKAIIEFFKTMRDWEAYTVFYLWRSLAG